MTDDKTVVAPDATAKEISYIGARLREKNTYGGLAVAIGIAASFFHASFPKIGNIDPQTLASAIEYIGLGIGMFIGIFLPEKGSPVGKISLGVSVILFALVAAGVLPLVVPALAMAKAPDQAAYASATKHAARIQVAQTTVPLPPVKPLSLFSAPASTTTVAPLSLPDAIQGVLTQLQNLQSTVVPNVVAALQAADADAATVVTPAIPAVPATPTTPAQPAVPAVVKDPISHACYPAQIQYLQSLPTAATSTSIPAPYNAIVLFQYKRDFINLLLSGQLIPTYLKLGCAPLLGNEAQVLAASLGLLGVGATALNPIVVFGTSLGAAAITAMPLLVFPK